MRGVVQQWNQTGCADSEHPGWWMSRRKRPPGVESGKGAIPAPYNALAYSNPILGPGGIPPHPVPDLEIAPKFLSDVVESLFCLLPGARVLVHDDDIESGGWTPFARQHLSGCQKRLHIFNVEKFVKHLLVFSLLERADLLPNLSKMGPRPDIRGFPILS